MATVTDRLPRTVGLLGATSVLVGSAIGSGIFRVPAPVAARLGEPGPVLLTWVLGGLLALFGALTLAELAAALPRSGGIFAYLDEAFGPLPAFLFGWTQLAVARAAALGGIATVFAEYLNYFLGLGHAQVRWMAAAVILIVAFINYIGVQRASRLMNVATITKYVAMFGLAVLIFTAGSGTTANYTPLFTSAPKWSLIATALVSVMWAYDGWADLSYMGGEIKNPARNFPLALIIGTVAIIVIYLTLNLAYLYVVPVPEMGKSALIASTAAERIPMLKGIGGGLVAGVVMLSCFSSLNGSIMTNPRVFFAMADRGLFFRAVARVSPRFKSPSVAIWLAAVLGAVYVLFNDFQQLADRFILGLWPFYVMSVIAVFVLRKNQPDLPRPYRVIGYPVVPILFLLAALFMIGNALVTDPMNTGVTLLIIVAGIPVYFVGRRFGLGAKPGAQAE